MSATASDRLAAINEWESIARGYYWLAWCFRQLAMRVAS